MSSLSQSVYELRQNERQRQAFEIEGHCVVLAPPGSGKTKLLATRLAYDLCNRIAAPQGAACITLTNPAADQLRKRISSLGVKPQPTLFIGTVHGFAFRRIISPFARAAGRADVADLKIADPGLARSLLDQCLSEVFGSTNQRLARTTIQYNRKRMATTEQWALSGPRIVEVAGRYEKKLRERGLMDFDDVVRFAVELVEGHKTVRRVMTACYPHFFVDEYQDLAPGLDRLIRALCFDYATPANLFAVGDPDQAVYGFTGTRPELLYDLASLPSVTSIELTINYRCGLEIVRRALRLLDNPQREVSAQRTGGKIEAHYEPGGFEAQVRRSASLVREAAETGTPLHEMVVLCATNAKCEEAASLLRSNGVPSYVRGSEYDRTPTTLMIEAMAAWASFGRERSGHRLNDLLDRWREALGEDWDRKRSVKLVSLLMHLAAQSTEPAKGFLDGLNNLGLAGALERAGRGDDKASLESLSTAISTGKLKGSTLEDLGQRARNVDRVEVTTMTSGKGLEFDLVFILGADDGVMPFFGSRNDESQLREERRKFYVSITRAREAVHILYSGFNATPYGVKWDGPSPFLRQLGLL